MREIVSAPSNSLCCPLPTWSPSTAAPISALAQICDASKPLVEYSRCRPRIPTACRLESQYDFSMFSFWNWLDC